MSSDLVVWTLDERGVATVTLNRPSANNAYNDALLGALLSAMDGLATQPVLRVVVLTGAGKHFQAVADLHWINALRRQTDAENVAASRQTFEAVQRLNRLQVPTVALVPSTEGVGHRLESQGRRAGLPDLARRRRSRRR